MLRHALHTSLYAFVASAVVSLPAVGAEVPEKLKPWLEAAILAARYGWPDCFAGRAGAVRRYAYLRASGDSRERPLSDVVLRRSRGG